MLLSGNSSSGNSASGIAWVNAYCRTNSSGGSYSTNQIFTNPAIGVASSAFIVGHELGHNFGASHTHCTNASSGSCADRLEHDRPMLECRREWLLFSGRSVARPARRMHRKARS